MNSPPTKSPRVATPIVHMPLSKPPRHRTWPAALLCALITLTTAPTSHAQAQTVAASAPDLITVAVNSPLSMPHLKDQYDQAWQVPADTRLVLFAAGRKAASLVQAVLEKEPPDFLPQRHTVYVVDMSTMPAFATRMFALPALRDMPFRVGVSLDETVLANWPRQPDAVTLIELAQGTVVRIGHAQTESELRTALGK